MKAGEPEEIKLDWAATRMGNLKQPRLTFTEYSTLQPWIYEVMNIQSEHILRRSGLKLNIISWSNMSA